MDTKEVIEILENRHKYKPYRDSAYNISEFDEAIDRIITLFKHSERYEKMWGEFKDRFGNGTMENDSGGRLGPINDIMDVIKQKYFPKK